TPGFESLAADVYWLRTVQYYGGRRRLGDGKKFALLGPLVGIPTPLGPRPEIASPYGPAFPSQTPPLAAGPPARGRALAREGSESDAAVVAPAPGPRFLLLPVPPRLGDRREGSGRGGRHTGGALLAADARRGHSGPRR